MSCAAYTLSPQRTRIMGTPSTSTARGAVSLTSSTPPTSTQCELMRYLSKHARLQTCRLGHHGLVPGRIEGELHLDLAHGWNALNLIAHVVDQDIAHAAPRGGEGDLDFHRARAVRVRFDLAFVHEAQVHDVDRDLRVVAGTHLLPGELLDVVLDGVGGQLRSLDRLLSDGVRVLAADAEQVAV